MAEWPEFLDLNLPYIGIEPLTSAFGSQRNAVNSCNALAVKPKTRGQYTMLHSMYEAHYPL